MKDLVSIITNFRDDRNWKQFHNPKDLAISLSLEASELLENFQWRSSEEAVKENIENIKDELSDVLIYSMLIANDLGLDIEEIVNKKIDKNKRKYPVEKSFGVKTKYTDL
ncbi:nucleotide pyrophosphohydrolase [Neobacillus sp. 179-J 1A1 HS]|uniref:nucleotide pyrophosphohydrolase n=1 Tax=Neobacillus driksii TaxID=3035913 RepID=UPI0035BC5F0E